MSKDDYTVPDCDIMNKLTDTLFSFDKFDFRAAFDDDIVVKDPGSIHLALSSLQADQIIFIACSKVHSLLLCSDLASKYSLFSLSSCHTEMKPVEFS